MAFEITFFVSFLAFPILISADLLVFVHHKLNAFFFDLKHLLLARGSLLKQHVVSRLSFLDQLLWHITNLKFKIMGFAIILVYFVLIQQTNEVSRNGLILKIVFY